VPRRGAPSVRPTPGAARSGRQYHPAVFTWASLCKERPAVMGIVNVTPDSFSDGGQYLDQDAAVAHGHALAAAGANLLDVGGESTRPGAEPVDEAEERRRVVPVVERLAGETGVPVSIDTTKPTVAAAALDAGAVVVNDVSAGRFHPALLEVVADRGAGYIAMHMRGEPRTMQRDPRYPDVVTAVGDFLLDRLDAARAVGVADVALAADPGIGFGKTPTHNLALLARLREICDRVEVPVLIGTSRKRFLGEVLAAAGADDSGDLDARDDATLATVVWAVDHGARIVRVHAARPAVRAVAFLTAMDEAAA
jgi:dihydropteroate synthase